jgi:hypothetical protein
MLDLTPRYVVEDEVLRERVNEIMLDLTPDVREFLIKCR